MRDHEVRVQRPGERFPRERELAPWGVTLPHDLPRLHGWLRRIDHGVAYANSVVEA